MAGSIWTPGLPNVASVTMTLAQNGPVAATQSLNIAQILGSSMYIQGKLLATAVGVAANAIAANLVLSNPISTSSVGLPVGDFIYQTAAGVRHTGAVYLNVAGSTAQLIFVVEASTGGSNAVLGISPALTIAIGDILTFSCVIPLA